MVAFSMGQTVLFALAGPLFREAGLAETDLGLIISAAAVVFVLGSPLWGRIADRWGRRPVVLLGLASYGATSLAFAWGLELGVSGVLAAGQTFTLLLVLRLLYAALGAGIQPSAVAIMADLSSEEERAPAVAIVGAAFGAGMILGPAAAAILVSFGVLVPLYAIAVLGLLCAGLVAFALPEPPRQRSAGTEAGPARLPLRRLLPLLATGLATYAAMSCLQQTLAFRMQDLLAADAAGAARAAGFAFMAIAAATLVMQAGVIQRLRPRPATLLLAGAPTALAGVLCYAAADTLVTVVAACALFGVGFGMLNPGISAAASLRAERDAQGAVAGLVQATMAGGFIVGPLAGTALYALEPAWASAFAAGSLAFATLLAAGTAFGDRGATAEARGAAHPPDREARDPAR